MFFILTLSSAIGLALGNIFESVGLRKANSLKSLANKFYFGGLLLSTISTLLYYDAMSKYNLSLVQPFMALNPALTAILGWKFLNEKITKRIAVAIALVFCGLFFDGSQAGESSGSAGLESVWFYAFAVIILSIALCAIFRDKEITDSILAGAGFGLSAVFYKSISLESLFPPPLDLRLLAFAVLYGGAFICSQIGLRRGRALFIIPMSAAVGLLVPAIGGIIVFGDPAPLPKIAGLIFVAAGSLLFIQKKK